MNLVKVDLDAEQLNSGNWVVRPRGSLGTVGFYPCPWTAQLVRAGSMQEALNRAEPLYYVDRSEPLSGHLLTVWRRDRRTRTGLRFITSYSYPNWSQDRMSDLVINLSQTLYPASDRWFLNYEPLPWG